MYNEAGAPEENWVIATACHVSARDALDFSNPSTQPTIDIDSTAIKAVLNHMLPNKQGSTSLLFSVVGPEKIQHDHLSTTQYPELGTMFHSLYELNGECRQMSSDSVEIDISLGQSEEDLQTVSVHELKHAANIFDTEFQEQSEAIKKLSFRLFSVNSGSGHYGSA